MARSQATIADAHHVAEAMLLTHTSVEFMCNIETIAYICAQPDEHMQYTISSRAADVVNVVDVPVL